MKTLYLHIGLPKTATTTIQNFLAINHSVLRQEGWLYPMAGRQYLARHHLGNFFRPEPLYWIQQVDPDACYRDLVAEVDASGCDNIVMSTESLYFTPDPSVIPPFFRDFRVVPVVFLRRQDEWLESAYREERKIGELRSSIEKYYQHMRPVMDYAATLKKWQKAFPDEKIIVGVFQGSKEKLPVEQEFLRCIGAEIRATLQPAPRMNEAFSRDALEFYIGFTEKRRIGPKHAIFKEVLSAYSKLNPDPPELQWFLPPAALKEIADAFEDGNSWVAKTFLSSDRPLFEIAVPDIARPWKPYDGLSIAKAIEIAEFLANGIYGQLAKEK